VALCHLKEQERPLDRLAFRLWWDGFTVDPDVIKDFLKAGARSMEGELRQAVASGKVARTFGAPLRQLLGRQRIAAISAKLQHVADPDTASRCCRGSPRRPAFLPLTTSLTSSAVPWRAVWLTPRWRT